MVGKTEGKIFNWMDFARIMFFNLILILLSIMLTAFSFVMLRSVNNDWLPLLTTIFLLLVFSIGWYITFWLLNKKIHRGYLMQKEIMAIADHDIRNPLYAARSGVSLLHQRFHALSDESKLEIVKALELETAQMLNIIEDLMDITRIESGLRDFWLEDFDVLEALRHQIKQFEILDVGRHQIMLKRSTRLKESHAPLTLHTDRFKFERIINNLLSNALRYGNQKSIVALIVKEGENGWVTVGVRCLMEEGILDQRDLPHIFERYYLAGKDSAARSDSTGMGMYIAKNLVDLLGGEIWAELNGREFIVWFSVPNLT